MNDNSHQQGGPTARPRNQPEPTAGDTTGGATLVQVADDGVPVTTSLIIAAETGNQHKNVLGLIRDNPPTNDVGWSRLKRELQVRARIRRSSRPSTRLPPHCCSPPAQHTEDQGVQEGARRRVLRHA